MGRISVFNHDDNPNIDRAHLRYSRSMAQALVDKGIAVWVHRSAVQRRPPGVQKKDADSEKNMQLKRPKTSTTRALYFDANQQRL